VPKQTKGKTVASGGFTARPREYGRAMKKHALFMPLCS
jgi:hypothetical protein